MKYIISKISKNKLTKFILNIIALIYVIFDEIFVYLSNKLNNLIDKYEVFKYLNQKLKTTNKYLILCLLLVVLAISEVIGIISFILLSKGLVYLFVMFYIIKFLPFFIVSYIFKQTKENLLTINWFNYSYNKVVYITDYLKSMEIVIQIKELKNKIKEKIQIKKSVLKEKIKFLIKKNKKEL